MLSRVLKEEMYSFIYTRLYIFQPLYSLYLITHLVMEEIYSFICIYDFLTKLTFGDGRGAGAASLFFRFVSHGDLPPDIFVRLEEDDVYLGGIKANECDGRAQADGNAESGDLCLVRVPGTKVYRDERQPYDAGCVHGEADELALVEVLRYFPRLHRVHGRDQDQQRVVQLGEKEAHILNVAFENHLLTIRIEESRARWLDDHPHQRQHDLKLFFFLFLGGEKGIERKKEVMEPWKNKFSKPVHSKYITTRFHYTDN